MSAVATFDAVDLFAGPGGWDEAALGLGLSTLGFEYDDAACETRAAAGHATVQGDLSLLDPRDFIRSLLTGEIASPPCQGFSMAGKGRARQDSERLLAALAECHTLEDIEALIADAKTWMSDPGTALVLEPIRWALAGLPAWCAWEQVPAVLPIWEACAVILRAHGYSVAVGKVYSEQYGVPQTRTRAVLVARCPWLTEALGDVELPAATHSRYHVRNPSKIDEGMPRWVSMAEALGWAATEQVGFPRAADSDDVVTINGEDYRARDLRDGNRPYFGVTEKIRSAVRFDGDPADVVMVANNAERANDRSIPRTGDKPAQTLSFGHNAAGVQWVEAERVNNQSGTEYDVAEQVDTPATSVAGRELVGFRGPNANRFNGSTKSRNDGIRVLPEEAAVLQTFRPDYPFQGSKTKVFQQIGNAVPPLLAEAVLCSVIGRPFRPALRGDQ